MPTERFRQTIKREELRGNKPHKKIDKEYPYSIRINILKSEEDLERIKSVFECFHEDDSKTRGGKKYYCMHEGKEIVINLNPLHPLFLYSKFNILESAKQKILDVLIG